MPSPMRVIPLLAVSVWLTTPSAWCGERQSDERPAATPRYTNHLAHEKSPYLQLHAHNPVDWYPWGDSRAVQGFQNSG